MFIIKGKIMSDRYLTREGLNHLKGELASLKTVKRREIAEAIHAAKEQADLSENAEYTTAKEEQQRTEEKIAQIETTIKNAQIVTHAGTERVSVGNKIIIICNGEKKEYHIVGSDETDPLRLKISNESPVGKALMGKKKGDIVHIPTPRGNKECEIVEIK